MLETFAVKSLLLIGGVLLTGALALGFPAISAHGEARSRWRAERDLVGSPSYSAERSDRLYEQADTARLRSQGAGALLGAALLFLLTGWRRYEGGDAQPTGRPYICTLIDGLLAWSLFAATVGVQHWLDPIESAWGAALRGLAPFLLFAPYAGLIWGYSVGVRATFGRFVAPTGRRWAALLLGPISLPLLAVGLPLSGRFPRLQAVHLPPQKK